MFEQKHDSIKLDIKIFSQINNDSESCGTQLEGNHVQNNIRYFIKWLQESQLDINKADLISKLTFLLDIEHSIDKAHGKFQSQEKTRQELIDEQINYIYNSNDKLQTKFLLDLKIGASIIILGGWGGKISGHAMIYEFTRIEEGYLFKVFNSGAGIDNHQIQAGCDKIRYSPIKAYKFQLQDKEYDVKFIESFIKELIKPRITPVMKAYNAANVYDIFKQLERIGAEEVCPYQQNIIKQEIVSAGQHSGSCAQKILHVFFQAHLNDRQLYKKYIYLFKKYSIEEHLGNMNLSALDIVQIKLAIENLARMIDKIEDSEFITKEKQEIVELFNRYKIIATPASTSPPEICEESQSLCSSFDINKGKSNTTKIPQSSGRLEESTKILRLARFNFTAQDWGREIKIFAASLSAANICEITSIEQFYLHFPINEDIRSKFQLTLYEDKSELLEHLNTMSQQYLERSKEKDQAKDRAFKVIYVAVYSKIFSEVMVLSQEGKADFLTALRSSFPPFFKHELAILNGCNDYMWDAQLMRAIGILFEQDIRRANLPKNKKNYIHSVISKYGIDDSLYRLFNDMSTDRKHPGFIEDKSRLGSLSMSMYVIAYLIKENQPLDSLLQSYSFIGNKSEFISKVNKIKADFLLYKNMIDSFSLVVNNYRDFNYDIFTGCNLLYPVFDDDFIKKEPFSKLSSKSYKYPEYLQVIFDNIYSGHSINELQIICSSSNISSSDLLFVRRFHQISNCEFRLHEVIRLFFREMPVYLLDPDKQIFLEKCIFGPIYLARAMQEKSYIIQELYRSLDNSIRQYIIGKESKEKFATFFLLRLKSKIITYNLDYYNLNSIKYPESFIDMYIEHTSELDKIITCTTTSLEFSRELMFCKIIMLHSFMETDKSKLLEQILKFNIIDIPLRDPQDSLIVEDIIYKLYLSLSMEHFSLAVSQFCTNVLHQKIDIVSGTNGLTIYQNKIKIGFASHKNCKVHILDMSIKCKFPNFIKSNARYKKVFEDYDPEVNFYPESNKYDFCYNGDTYIIKYSNNKALEIFRKFTFYRQPEQIFKLQSNKDWYSCLPSYFLIDSVCIWSSSVSCHEINLIMQDTKHKKYYLTEKIQQDSKTLYRIKEYDNNFKELGFIVSDPCSLMKINNFEIPEYVKIMIMDLRKLYISLPRYGLVFEASFSKDKATIKSIFLGGTDFEVIDHKLIIPGFNHQLVLANKTSKFVFFPVAEFILDPESSENSLDTRGFKIIILDRDQDIQRQYHNQREVLYKNNNPFKTRYIKLEMKDGQLFPMNMADGLYLSYVYICNNHYQQAFNMLEYIKLKFRMIKGTDHEIDYIRWIVDSLPAVNKVADLDRRITPGIVAVQIKALSLLTEFKNENGKFKILYSPIYHSQSLNRDYDQHLYNKRERFYHTAEIIISNIISQYLKLLSNIPNSIRLSENEIFSLLNVIESQALPIRFKQESLLPSSIDRRAFVHNVPKLVEVTKNEPLTKLDWPLWYDDVHMKSINKNEGEGLDYLKKIFCQFELPLYPTIRNEFIKILYAIHNARTDHKMLMVNLFGRIICDPQYKNDYTLQYLYAFVHFDSCSEFSFFNQISKNYVPRIPYNKGLFSHTELETSGNNAVSFVLVKPLEKERLKILRDATENIPNNYLIQTIKHLLPQDFYQDWTSIATETDKKIEDLKQQYIALQTLGDKYETRSKKENELEQNAGDFLHALETRRISICQKECFQKSIMPIKQLCGSNKQLLTQQLEEIKKEILDNANKYSSYKKIGQGNIEITFDLILKLFGRNDKRSYKDITSLEEKAIEELHTLMAKYITMSTHLAHFDRIINIIDQIMGMDRDNPIYASSLYKLGIMLNEKNLVDTATDPEMQLFQFDQGIFIRQDQLNSIESLLEKNRYGGYKNKIIQLIMGAGKTTVLLNMLALKRADGTNLSIIEVPEPLYESNLASLNNITSRLYGQNPFGLKFDRDTPCGEFYLKNLYFRFEKIRSERNYIVTTKSSIACLELKFQTLLNDNNYEPPVEGSQLYWLFKIMKLIKEYGDCLVDEVHKSLDLRQEINFTLGSSQRLAAKDINDTCELFEFMDTVEIKSVGQDNLTMLSFLNDSEGFSKHTDILAHALAYQQNSPLKLNIEDNAKEEIKQYLLGKTDKIPGIVLRFNNNESSKIMLYRGQLNKLLPHTFGLTYRVHYGPSCAKNKNKIERLVAIPYAGNEEPKENSKNTNDFKTINLTIQIMLNSGISEDLLRDLVDKWHTIAINQVRINMARITIDKCDISQEINELLLRSGIEGINLIDICKYKPEQFTNFANQIRYSMPMMLYILKNEILPTYTNNSKIATLNSINYVDIFRSLSGLTGTPSNFRTMNSKIEFTPTATLGTDGLTCTRLKSKQPKVIPLKFDNINIFMNLVIMPDLRAIIDVAPAFKGIANNQVAIELAKFIFENQEQFSCPIKFLIYFDKEQGNQMAEPFALPINFSDLLSDRVPLKGMSKLEIVKILASVPDAWFIYFDHLRTIGTDFELSPNAHAILTLDTSSTINDLAQGVNRLRDLSGQQSVTVVVPKNMPLDINSIISFCSENLSSYLKEEHFDAACAIIYNFVRNFLRDRSFDLLDSNNPKDGSELSEKSKKEEYGLSKYNSGYNQLFFKKHGDPKNEYGAIERRKSTEEILKMKAEEAMKLLFLDDQKRLKPQIDAFISQALKNFEETKIVKTGNLGSDAQEEQETESESEQQCNTKSQKNHQMSLYHAIADYDWLKKILPTNINWPKNLSSDSFFEWPSDPNIYCIFAKWPILNLYDKIYISRSQLFTCDNSIKAIKELQMVMFVKDDDSTNAYFIDYHEASHIKSILDDTKTIIPENMFIWLAQVTGDVVAGIAPTNVSYSDLFECINYYQGYLGYLSKIDLTQSLLLSDLPKFMQGLEKEILPCRLHDPKEFAHYKSMLEKLDRILNQVVCTKEVDSHELSIFNEITQNKIKGFINFIALLKKNKNVDDNNVFFKGVFRDKILANRAVLFRSASDSDVYDSDEGEQESAKPSPINSPIVEGSIPKKEVYICDSNSTIDIKTVSYLGVGFYISLSLFIIFTSSIFIFTAAMKRNLKEFFSSFKLDSVHIIALMLIILSAISSIFILYFAINSATCKVAIDETIERPCEIKKTEINSSAPLSHLA